MEEQKVKNTAQVLVECLREEGVDTIFGIPGEETLDLMFAIKESGIHFIDTRHEQGAAFMADVYGRLTGRALGRSFKKFTKVDENVGILLPNAIATVCTFRNRCEHCSQIQILMTG